MLKKIVKQSEFSTLILLVAFVVVMSIVSPSFMSVNNISNIVYSTLTLATLAFGMTAVMITCGIDVSIAPQMILGSVISNVMMRNMGVTNVFVLILGVALIGALIGAINGFLISYLHIVPIIATLGTMDIIRGAMLQISGAKWITNLPEWYLNIARAKVLGIPITVLYMIGFCLIFTFIMKKTRFGRNIYAIGGNAEAARRCGVNVQRTRFLVYLMMGITCGIAGMLNGSRMGNVQVSGSVGLEMQVIAAVVMGGTSVVGGAGSPFGSLLGALLFGVIDNALVLLRVPNYWQKAVSGAIIVVAITVNISRSLQANSKIKKVDI